MTQGPLVVSSKQLATHRSPVANPSLYMARRSALQERNRQRAYGQLCPRERVVRKLSKTEESGNHDAVDVSKAPVGTEEGL